MTSSASLMWESYPSIAIPALVVEVGFVSGIVHHALCLAGLPIDGEAIVLEVPHHRGE